MKLISNLYNLTERQVEVYVNENLSAMYFVGLSVEEKAPDHSILIAFRERLIRWGLRVVFERVMEDIIRIALESGVKFGAIRIVDSVHSVADVKTDKDHNRVGKKGKGPRDPDPHGGLSTSAR